MNDAHGDYGSDSSYDTFISDVEFECSMLWGVTKQKIEEEGEAIEELAISTYGASTVYHLFNSETVANLPNTKASFEYTRDNLIFKFAENYCFDYQPVHDAQACLTSALDKFKIGTALRELTDHLATSWPAETNDSALKFRENFIDPIADIKSDQVAALELAHEDLDAIPEMVKANRTALLGAIREAKATLESYIPKTHLMLASIHLQLFAWGLVAPDPVSGRAASIVDFLLSKAESNLIDTDIGCADEVIQQLNFAMVDALEKAGEVVDGIRGMIDLTNEELNSADKKYILNAPGE